MTEDAQRRPGCARCSRTRQPGARPQARAAERTFLLHRAAHTAKVTMVPASLTAKSAHSVPALTRAALHSRSVRCHRRGASVSPSCAPHDTWPCLAEGRSFSLLQGVVCPRGRRSGLPASETGAAACHTPCPFSSPPGAFPARGSCSAQGGQRALHGTSRSCPPAGSCVGAGGRWAISSHGGPPSCEADLDAGRTRADRPGGARRRVHQRLRSPGCYGPQG